MPQILRWKAKVSGYGIKYLRIIIAGQYEADYLLACVNAGLRRLSQYTQ
jgi:hypothetical protein